MREVRSGCVGTGTKFVAGSANLHKLPGINTKAGSCQIIHDAQCRRQEPLLPVSSKLADDIFDVVFINQDIILQKRFRVLSLFCIVKNLLLIP